MRNIFEKTVRWPWIWWSVVAVGTIAFFIVYAASPQYSWIAVAAIAFLTLLLILSWHLFIRKTLLQSIVNVGLSVDEELKDRLQVMSLPYAVLSRQGKVLWRNEAFTELVDRYATPEQIRTGQIQDIFPGAVFWEKGLSTSVDNREFVTLGDKIFETHVRHTVGRLPVATFLLTDETEHIAVRTELNNERNAVGLIYVDNYEELLKHTPTEQHSLLGALIEQQIQKYFQDRGGIVCKTERDRFFISIKHEGLEKCREDRFSLLE